MDPTQQWCENVACADFLKVGAGNIKVYSYRERRYYCVTCHQTFSAERGTFFETLRSEPSVVVDVLALLMERNSLRAVERLRHHAPNAILHWVDLAGQHAAAVSARVIQNLHLTQAQIDELWTFVKKSKNTCKRPTRLTPVTCGSGERLPCRADSAWSAISVMNAVKPKPSRFWLILRLGRMVMRPCSPAINCPRISRP